MSLSARIALEPSRRIARAECSLALAGIAVASAALAQRWPAWWPTWLASAGIATVLFATWAARRSRRSGSTILAVSNRTACEVHGAGPAFPDGTWRLTESTVLWPGFALLTLAHEGGRRVLRLPVLLADLTAADRRALGRFLLWSMRGRVVHDSHDDTQRGTRG